MSYSMDLINDSVFKVNQNCIISEQKKGSHLILQNLDESQLKKNEITDSSCNQENPLKASKKVSIAPVNFLKVRSN